MDGMDGGAEGRRSALQKQNRPRIQTSLSGTVRGGKEVEEGRGVACKFYFAPVIIIAII